MQHFSKFIRNGREVAAFFPAAPGTKTGPEVSNTTAGKIFMGRKLLSITGWLFLLLVLASVTPPHPPPFCTMPGDPSPPHFVDEVFAEMLFAPVVGAIFGIARVLSRSRQSV